MLKDMSPADVEATIDQLRSLRPDALPFEDRLTIWGNLRDFIGRHRQFASADWAISPDIIDSLESIYKRIEPNDPIKKIAWLFNDSPMPLQCRTSDWRERQKIVTAMRIEEVRSLLDKRGFDAVVSLARCVDHPISVGVALASTSVEDDTVFDATLGSTEASLREVAFGFLVGGQTTKNANWIEGIRTRDEWRSWNPAQRANYFLVQPFRSDTWNLIAKEGEDVQRRYWTQVSILGRGNVSREDRDRAVRKFMKYGWLTTAVRLLDLYAGSRHEPADEALVLDVLEAITRDENAEPNVDWVFLSNEISRLLTIARRGANDDESRIARLEWIYLPFLLAHDRSAEVLQKALARDPALFVEVVKVALGPRNERAGDEAFAEERLRAKLGNQLLASWTLAPGVHDGRVVDETQLNEWVRVARELGDAAGLSAVVDEQIGRVLAHSPAGTDGLWPHEALRELVETIACERVERGIRIELGNMRGFVTKSLWEGGEQERGVAQRYRNYSSRVADAWPRTSRLLRQVAEDYEATGHREDTQAELDEATDH